MVDYANDLNGVMTRAFDIRTGPQTALDAINTAWQTMKTNATSAATAVDTARQKINQLQSDISKAQADNVQQKYFLGVAQQFGDSLRLPTIQASIDTNNTTIGSDQSQLTQANSDLSDALDKASKSLTGNSAGAIANRAALIDLISKDQDYIDKLAASGASQETLRKTAEKLRTEFINQATQLGFNKTDVDKLAGSFTDMTRIINAVPRNITVTANANPAIQALNEYAAAAAKTAAAVNKSLSGAGGSITPISYPTSPSDGAREDADKASLAQYKHDWLVASNNGQTSNNAAMGYLDLMNQYAERLRTGNYYDGGFTGPGGKYEAAGVVHKGEYVVPQYMVNQATGLPYADAFGKLVGGTYAQGNGGYASGGYVNTDMMVTELGPRSLGVLRQMVAKEMAVYLDGKPVTSTVNTVNRMDRRRGRGN